MANIARAEWDQAADALWSAQSRTGARVAIDPLRLRYEQEVDSLRQQLEGAVEDRGRLRDALQVVLSGLRDDHPLRPDAERALADTGGR